MWYFAWILGVTLAMALGAINVMWLEQELTGNRDDSNR